MAKRLGRLAHFEAMPAAVLNEVAAQARLRVCHRGEFVWKRGDTAATVIVIESGFVKAAHRDRRGDSKTYAIFGPGDVLGVFAYCSDNSFPTDAVALNDDLQLITLDTVQLTRLIAEHPLLADMVQAGLTHFCEALMDKIEIISAGKISQRLAAFFVQLVDRYGVSRAGGKVDLPFYLPHEQIGEIVDARVESVARVLAAWKRAGWIKRDVNGFHFKELAKLRAILQE